MPGDVHAGQTGTARPRSPLSVGLLLLRSVPAEVWRCVIPRAEVSVRDFI